MFNKDKPGKCMMINAACPENNDPRVGNWCPHWQQIEETNNVTGEKRTSNQCDIPIMFRWMSDVQQSGWMGAKFLQSLDNARVKQGNVPIGHDTVGIPPQELLNG